MNCEAITTTNEELLNQNEYLRRQLGESLKQKGKILASSSSPPCLAQEEESERDHHPLVSSSEEEPQRRPRRGRRFQPNLNDFRVNVSEFEGKLDLDHFFEWLHTIERVFDFKEIPKEKKVKLLLSSLESIHLFGGLICVPRE